MTKERLATLRERAKAYRSRPVAFDTAQRLANMELAADAAESLHEALNEIERLRAELATAEHAVGAPGISCHALASTR